MPDANGNIHDLVPKEWRAKVKGTLINPDTLLATDYMNHFNEVVMLIEMLPDMPDMLPDCVAWQPKTYAEHFRGIALDYGPLAADAYSAVPSAIKVPFELTVAQLNAAIHLTVKRAAATIAINDPDELRRVVTLSMAALRRLSEALAGIINGSKQTVDQADIDAMMDGYGDPAASSTAPSPAATNQSDIDKLFD
jgi:hypothetical protein